MNEKELHEKAIRLIEGGVVEVQGLSVRLGRQYYYFDPCFCCKLDSICHFGDDMCSLCLECDRMTDDDCYLILHIEDRG